MYNDLCIENLRGIRQLSLSGFSRVNLLLGRNNAGKSTVLEALFLLGGATDPVIPSVGAQLRGQWPFAGDTAWRSWFHGMDPKGTIRIQATWGAEQRPRSLEIKSTKKRRFAVSAEAGPGTLACEHGSGVINEESAIGGIQLCYRPAAGEPVTVAAMVDPVAGTVQAEARERPDFVRTSYLPARSFISGGEARQFSELVKIRREEEVVEAMQLIEPRTRRIKVLTESGGVPVVFIDVGLPALIPLASAGDGFVRLFALILSLTASAPGVLLVDEIDNGLHHSVMRTVWRVLRALAVRRDVQVFATTHNEELLEQAMEEFQQDADELSIFRIDRIDAGHRAVRYDRALQEAVLKEGFEIRG